MSFLYDKLVYKTKIFTATKIYIVNIINQNLRQVSNKYKIVKGRQIEGSMTKTNKTI